MHLVVKSHFENFLQKFPTSHEETKAFEAFVNYCLFNKFSSDSVNPYDLIYDGDDPGIDGVMIFADDIYISSVDEVDHIFSGRARELDVSIVFVQTKTSEKWSKADINTFRVAVDEFLSEDPSFPMSEYLLTMRECYFQLFKFIGKIKNGKPSVYCYFATTARKTDANEIDAAFKSLEVMLTGTDYFGRIFVGPIDRDGLIQLWTAVGGSISAQIPTIGIAPFPKSPGIIASYVATVRAIDFVNDLLVGEDGKLRQRIFDDNVRDFIGFDAEVNKEIQDTIVDPEKQKRFGVMNNGVTIVSPDVRVQGNEIYLSDYQIVNGCQTSNVLFECRDKIGIEANLMIKVIHANESLLIEDIVRSTNRQSKVQDDQFLATLDCIKSIERYFEARGQDQEHSLFLERRKNQYSARDIPAIRIFGIKDLARCVGSMFLDRPDLASRYPNRLTGEMQKLVFNPAYKEEIFYTAAHCYYRIGLHIGNQRISSKLSKVKWHLLMAIKYFIAGDEKVNLRHNNVIEICDRIRNLVASGKQSDIEHIRKLSEAVFSDLEVPRDQLKTQTMVATTRDNALSFKNQQQE
ncbi:MAG: AIPR family protein [Thermohalobaculum sp.]